MAGGLLRKAPLVSIFTVHSAQLSHRGNRRIIAGYTGKPVQNEADLEANLKEELADVLDQVLILSAKFKIDPNDLLAQSEHKLKARFKKDV